MIHTIAELDKKTHAKGFTLIEVLIALVILAISLMAISKTVNSHIQGANYLEDKTIASWVAENTLVAFNLNIAPAPQTIGSTLLLKKNWYWRVNIQPLIANPDLEQITIEVTNTLNSPALVKLSGLRLSKSA